MVEKLYVLVKYSLVGIKEIVFMERFVDKKGNYGEKKINFDFFEKLIEWYKVCWIMYKDFMGVGYVEILDKFDGLYR